MPVYQLRNQLLLIGALALLVVGVAAAWLSRALLGPLRELTAGVRRFAAGDYAANVPVRTRDEIGQLCFAFNAMVEDLREKNEVIQNKNCENEELLLNVLPAPIANRLRGGEARIAYGFAEVTVAFADLVGFTALTSEMPPHDVVTFVNGLFTRFDVAAQDLGIEKIKTVGDAYMAVCGLPVPVVTTPSVWFAWLSAWSTSPASTPWSIIFPLSSGSVSTAVRWWPASSAKANISTTSGAIP